VIIHVRRGTVVTVHERRPGLAEVTYEVGGIARPALAYTEQTGPVRLGAVVIVNASAVELGLGTGGYDFVMAVEGAADLDPPPGGRAMKLRYTAMQSVVTPLEESHRERLDAFDGLGGAPVVLSGLHSALPAVALGVRSSLPAARIVYVMTDAAALPMAFSDTVASMRDAGLLDATITAGQAFGGDLEAVNVYSAIAAASAVCEADVVVAGMGPGNLGTGSRLGFALLEQGALVNAVASLRGTPIVVPRISFTDPRQRHRGVSHHTVAAMSVAALGSATIAVPDLDESKDAIVRAALEPLAAWHRIEHVDLAAAEEMLRSSPVPLRTMGRSYHDEPEPFRAAAAAGVLAARLTKEL
jgi:hypothetical protein